MLRKVTELGSNEVIHCPTEEQAIAICKLMHEAGLEWCTNVSYIENNKWNKGREEMCYCPKKGEYSCYNFYKSGGYTIYPATDFLSQIEDTPQQYTITREQAKELNAMQSTLNGSLITMLQRVPFDNCITIDRETILHWHNMFAEHPKTIEWLNANELNKPKQKVEVVRYALIDKDGDISSIERTKERAIEFSQGNYEIVKLSGSYEI